MQRIKNPIGLFFVYLTLLLFILYSIAPFVWTTLQSLKTIKQATARTPLFIFEPTRLGCTHDVAPFVDYYKMSSIETLSGERWNKIRSPRHVN